jgi:hypothetical protein
MELLIVMDNGSTDQVGVSSDILAAAIVGNISTQEKWGLKVGSGEGVIDDDSDFGVLGLGHFDGLIDVDKLHGGVGWGLDPDELGVFGDGVLDVLDISHVNEFDIDTEIVLGEQSQISLGSSINIVTYDDVISCFHGVDDGGSSSTS